MLSTNASLCNQASGSYCNAFKYTITASFDLLVNSIPLNSTVNLNNDQIAHITHLGFVSLTSEITLHNVLYIPSFHFNLILGSKIAQDSNLCRLFFPTHYLFQDLQHKSVKRIGKMSGGLYKLVLKWWPV